VIGGRQAGRGTLLAVGVVLCCLGASAPAGAGTPGATVSLGTSKGLEYMKGKYAGVVTQTSQPVACDGDAETTGGGGSIKGLPDQVFLNESFPTLPGPSGWTVEGTSTDGPQDMTGYAICAGIDANVGTAQEDIPAGSSATQNAFCPSSEELVTGGGIEASSNGVRIEATYPPELITDRWFGSAKNTSGGTISVDYHAVCTDAYIVKYRYSDVVNVKSGKEATASASCKPTEAVLGGGFVGFSEGLPASGGWAKESRPRDSKKDRKKVPDDGWRAKYYNGAVVTHRLLVVAACKKGNAPD
jgi:hypothetical protein